MKRTSVWRSHKHMNSMFMWRGFRLPSYLPIAGKSLLWDPFILVTDYMLLGSRTLNECKLPEMWYTDQKTFCIQVVAIFSSRKGNCPLWTFKLLKRQHAACFHYFIKFIITWPWNPLTAFGWATVRYVLKTVKAPPHIFHSAFLSVHPCSDTAATTTDRHKCHRAGRGWLCKHLPVWDTWKKPEKQMLKKVHTNKQSKCAGNCHLFKWYSLSSPQRC